MTIGLPTRPRSPELEVPPGDVWPVAREHRLLRPGWPLAALFVPFPLWWALGLSEWIVPITVLPMVLHLLRQRVVAAPRGFGWWMAFLLWVVVGGILLKVDAFGAVADNSSTRLITFGYRLIWYVSITVVLLYVVNARAQLSATRVCRIVACMFVTVTLGGVLGVFAPYFEFRSLVELLLPGSLGSIQFIQKMIHPQAAELQQVLGYVSPRPSAPFAFTNTWGLNFALTLPFFLHAWCGKDAGWRRWAAGPVLLVAAVPGVYSINRGMWGALVAMGIFLAARAAITGKPAVLAALVAGAAAVAVVVAVSPLGDVVSSRFSNEGSEQGRTNLGTLTVQSVTATSPIVGLGSTRNVQGNFQSITGGSTAQCPRCSPPALGTQGQIWLVVFSQGLVGLALFGVFFALMFLRHIRLRSPVATVGLSVLVAWSVTLFVYNSLGMGMLVVMVAVGLLCREAAELSASGSVPRSSTGSSIIPLSRYSAAIRGALPLVLVCTLLGLAVGATWTALSPSPFKATTSVVLSAPPRYPTTAKGPMNVDTDGQLVAGDLVKKAAATASGRSLADVAEDLTVTATPNTRVLHLHFTAPTEAAAVAGVKAAARSYLDQRTQRLDDESKAELAVLQRRADTLADAIDMVDRDVADIKNRVAKDIAPGQTALIRDRRSVLLTQSHKVGRQIARINGQQLVGGRQTAQAVAVRSGDRARVALVSGVTAGLGLGAMLALLRGAAGPRLRRVRDVHQDLGLPLLARVPHTPDGVRDLLLLLHGQPIAYVAVDENDPTASGLAHALQHAAGHLGPTAGAVVVASEDTRIDQVLACRDRLVHQGVRVRGLVLATEVRTRRKEAVG